MRRMHLDFIATRPPTRMAGWLLLLLGLVGSGAVLTWDRIFLQPVMEVNTATLHSLEARQPPVPKFDETRLVLEWTRAIAVANELNLPWENLFTTFESNLDLPVAILSLDPDAGKHELTLTGEAKNLEAMLAYYRWLQQKEIFSGLALHTHQVNRQDQENPIRFRITAKWMAQS